MFKTVATARSLSLALLALLMGLFLLIPSVSAQDVGQLCTGADLSFHSAPGSHPCDTGTDDHGNPIPASSKLSDLLARIINFISIIVAIAAILMIIYAGFRLVTSGGSAESTKSARDTILYAVIGLVVVLFAQVIVKFVLAKITGGSESS